MSWSNDPAATIRESAKVVIETAYRVITQGSTLISQSRSRTVSYLTVRHVGMNYDGAKALADEQAAISGNTDVNVQETGGGQYQVVVVKRTDGTWGAWS